ncbi:dihydrofolate reductase family protein [Patescibacteria group bacterium]
MPDKITKTSPRPETTLILASSVDGRLTSSDSNPLDKNKNWKQKPGVRGYLQQFYEITSEAGVYNLIPGSRMAHINDRIGKPEKEDIRLIVLDHHRDLTAEGIVYLSKCVNRLILVCGNKHPITDTKKLPSNLSLIRQPRFMRKDLLIKLHKKKVKKVTIQSAGKLNSKWINEGLIDHLTIIVYPLLVGSSGTHTLINHKLSAVRPLRLVDIRPFNLNYISLNYEVLND